MDSVFESSSSITPIAMDRRMIATCLGVASGAGILSHLLYFIRGEHHRHTLQLIQALCVSFPICILVLIRLLHFGFGQAICLSVAIIDFYLISLWTSMIIYRAHFHRLSAFPGPWYLKLSRFFSLIALRRMDGFRKVHSWHQKYGSFVRTGALTRHFRRLLMFCFMPCA